MKKVVSFFSGCGGMDLGLEGEFSVKRKCINENIHPEWIIEELDNSFVKLSPTGFHTVFANDILPTAEIAWNNYFGKKSGDRAFYLDSIIDLIKKVHSGDFSFPENVDIVTGGFPCQDFSISGKRKGLNSHKNHKNQISDDHPTIESRGMLYYWLREAISIIQPKVFIAENVKGLKSLDNVFSIIQQDFSNIQSSPYVLVPVKTLNAANFGVPQKRERIIFIGLSKKHLRKEALDCFENGTIPSHLDPYPEVTHIEIPSVIADDLYGFVNSGEVLSDLKEPDISSDLSQQSFSKAKRTKGQGQIEIDLNGLSPTIRAEHHGNIEYRRLSFENGGKNKNELAAGQIERRLTVRECARIQTFPDDYQFVISSSKHGSLSASNGYKLIGNAVPPLLAYNIAKRLESIWDDLFKS